MTDMPKIGKMPSDLNYNVKLNLDTDRLLQLKWIRDKLANHFNQFENERSDFPLLDIVKELDKELEGGKND